MPAAPSSTDAPPSSSSPHRSRLDSSRRWTAPGQTPPPGLVGYWSDGAGRSYTAMQTATGTTLFTGRDGSLSSTNTVLALLPH
jgi:hypothetical protein